MFILDVSGIKIQLNISGYQKSSESSAKEVLYKVLSLSTMASTQKSEKTFSVTST